jgi:hypothetical protein
MQIAGNLDALKWWWLWGIYSPNHQNSRWEGLLSMGASDSLVRHRTVRCATRHCLVRQPRYPTVRVLTVSTVGSLTSWGTGQSGAAPDKHCSLSGAPCGSALTMRELSAHCSHHYSFLQTTVGVVAVALLGTPDSPVLHRIVR